MPIMPRRSFPRTTPVAANFEKLKAKAARAVRVGQGHSEAKKVDELFLALWTKAVGANDYVKAEWRELGDVLGKAGYRREKQETAMKAMDGEKVAKFLSFLNGEVKSQWDERTKLRGKGKDDLAYNCKMKASQTELIRAVFLKLVNDEPMEITEQDLVRTS